MIVDCSRAEFIRVSRIAFDLVEAFTTKCQFISNIKTATTQHTSSKMLVLSEDNRVRSPVSESKNSVQEFLLYFNNELKNYYRGVSTCLKDLDFQQFKGGKSKVDTETKELWVKSRLEHLAISLSTL